MSDEPDAVRDFRGEGVAWVDVEGDDGLSADLGLVDAESGDRARIGGSDEPGRYVLIRASEADGEDESSS